MNPLLLTVLMAVSSLMVGSSGSPIPFVGSKESQTRSEKLLDAGLLVDDIIPETLSRNALNSDALIWPDGEVYYKIEKQFDEEQVRNIYKAMHRISAVSCVRFIPAPENATTFLEIGVHPDGCESHLGYAKGVRSVSLALHKPDTGCFKLAAIEHELMHALGFIHQQSVPDRDNYVKIIYENIDSVYYENFAKWPKGLIQDFGLPYDFGSLMHYKLVTFSKNGKRTIEPIVDPGDVEIGQEKGLSQLDILKLNKLYKCCV